MVDRSPRGIGPRIRTVLIVMSWMPWAAWLSTLLYMRGLDGWGTWAAAPMLLPAVFLSIGLGSVGVVAVALDYQANGRVDKPLALATFLSASLILYLVGMNVFR
jgi:hypothetical protein